MEFPGDVVQEAWIRAGSKCECQAAECAHGGDRCNAMLGFPSRGRSGQWGWDVRPAREDGPETAENCQIVCSEC